MIGPQISRFEFYEMQLRNDITMEKAAAYDIPLAQLAVYDWFGID